MERNSRVNTPVNWWGLNKWLNWLWDVEPPDYPDGVRCDSEIYRVDSYKIKSDDEGTE